MLICTLVISYGSTFLKTTTTTTTVSENSGMEQPFYLLSSLLWGEPQGNPGQWFSLSGALIVQPGFQWEPFIDDSQWSQLGESEMLCCWLGENLHVLDRKMLLLCNQHSPSTCPMLACAGIQSDSVLSLPLKVLPVPKFHRNVTNKIAKLETRERAQRHMQ